jgi:hypothetical protein
MMIRGYPEPLNSKTVTNAERSFETLELNLPSPPPLLPQSSFALAWTRCGNIPLKNGTIQMQAGYRYCTFQKHCITFVTFNLRNDHSPGNTLGQDQEF